MRERLYTVTFDDIVVIKQKKIKTDNKTERNNKDNKDNKDNKEWFRWRSCGIYK